MRTFQGALGEQDPVVREDADRVAHDACEPADQCLTVERLELVQSAAINDAGDDLAHVVALTVVARDDTVQLLGGVERLLWLFDGPRWRLFAVQVLYDGADNGESVLVVLGEVVGDARAPGVHLRTTELFGGYLFAGGGLHQRPAAQEEPAPIGRAHG